MFMVYWIEIQGEIKNPQCKEFDSDDMVVAMQYMESLRRNQRDMTCLPRD